MLKTATARPAAMPISTTVTIRMASARASLSTAGLPVAVAAAEDDPDRGAADRSHRGPARRVALVGGVDDANHEPADEHDDDAAHNDPCQDPVSHRTAS